MSVRYASIAVAAALVLSFGNPTPGSASSATALRDLSLRSAIAGSVSDRDGILSFYRDRDFEPLWLTGADGGRDRLEALLSALAEAPAHGLPDANFDAEALLARLRTATSPHAIGLLDAHITKTYIDYATAMTAGVVRPRDIDPVIMPRDVEVPEPAQLLSEMMSGTPTEVLRDLIPDSPEYRRLFLHKLKLDEVVASGGWGAPISVTGLGRGDDGSRVLALRERLQAVGFLGNSVTATYDAEIAAAVSAAQAAYGLPAEEGVSARLEAALNVPAEARLQQVVIAMERERWLPDGRGMGREIWVNLPAFETVVLDDGKETFRTISVIGKAVAGRYTPEFSDHMDHMVVNPTWYVPRSIAVRDYLPRLRANPNAASYMKITDSRGREVSRANGFSQYTARSFPFSMRQPPGPNNALGFVKFMFPNEHAIYLHDSPAKHLYDEDIRAFSSGCVRLEDPFGFAYHLLERQEADPEGMFNRILNTKAERRINLEQEIPVHLVYRTAFTDARGGLHFREDVYGRDAMVLDALGTAGVDVGRASGVLVAEAD